MGALFAGSECVIEKARARHDAYNSVYAGQFASYINSQFNERNWALWFSFFPGVVPIQQSIMQNMACCCMCFVKAGDILSLMPEPTVLTGCFAGGALAYSAGPKGMCLGCASFAAFSYMIDRFMER